MVEVSAIFRTNVGLNLLEALIILTRVEITRKFITPCAWCPLRQALDWV